MTPGLGLRFLVQTEVIRNAQQRCIFIGCILAKDAYNTTCFFIISSRSSSTCHICNLFSMNAWRTHQNKSNRIKRTKALNLIEQLAFLFIFYILHSKYLLRLIIRHLGGMRPFSAITDPPLSTAQPAHRTTTARAPVKLLS